MRRPAALLLLGALSGCGLFRRPPPPAPPQPPHYVGEQAWHGDGVWFYPRESYALDQTGLAAVYPAGHAGLTTDGEAFDQSAMAAAHQTLQLPAVLRITDLQNGRQILVRVNDRGPGTPHRVLLLTRRAAALLGIPADGTAPVRLQVEEGISRQLVEQLGGGAPKLALAAVPRGAVQQEALPPPGAAPVRSPSSPVVAPADPTPAPAAVPLRLPETVTQLAPEPGQLWIRVGEFSRIGYAERQRALLAPYGQVERVGTGRGETYRVKAGPFATPSQADEALDQALRAGLTDARIVVE